MTRLFVVHRKRGGSWDFSHGLREQVLWNEHAVFMDGLVDSGFVVLGGPLDERRVMLIVTAGSEAAVRERLAEDPWSVNGMLTTTSVEAWSILLDGR